MPATYRDQAAKAEKPNSLLAYVSGIIDRAAACCANGIDMHACARSTGEGTDRKALFDPTAELNTGSVIGQCPGDGVSLP